MNWFQRDKILLNVNGTSRFALICLWTMVLGWVPAIVAKALGWMPTLFSWQGAGIMLFATSILIAIPTIMHWRGWAMAWAPITTLFSLNLIILFDSYFIPQIGTTLVQIWFLPCLFSLLYLQPRLVLSGWLMTAIMSYISLNFALRQIPDLGEVQIRQLLISHEVAVAMLFGAAILFCIQMRQVVLVAMKAREREVEARVDGLTGAYNYRFLQEYSLQIRSETRPHAIIMLDVDKFKEVNDKYGHMVGDEVLRRLVKVLRENLRASDLICRQGGDEFAVVLETLPLAGTIVVAERLRKAFGAESFQVESQGRASETSFTLSVGVALYDPEQDNNVLHEADQAMYTSKQAGRNCVTEYVPQWGSAKSDADVLSGA